MKLFKSNAINIDGDVSIGLETSMLSIEVAFDQASQAQYISPTGMSQNRLTFRQQFPYEN